MPFPSGGSDADDSDCGSVVSNASMEDGELSSDLEDFDGEYRFGENEKFDSAEAADEQYADDQVKELYPDLAEEDQKKRKNIAIKFRREERVKWQLRQKKKAAKLELKVRKDLGKNRLKNMKKEKKDELQQKRKERAAWMQKLEKKKAFAQKKGLPWRKNMEQAVDNPKDLLPKDRLLSTEEIQQVMQTKKDSYAYKSVEKWGLFGAIEGDITSINLKDSKEEILEQRWTEYYRERVAREREMAELKAGSASNSSTPDINNRDQGWKVQNPRENKPGDLMPRADDGGIMNRSRFDEKVTDNANNYAGSNPFFDFLLDSPGAHRDPNAVSAKKPERKKFGLRLRKPMAKTAEQRYTDSFIASLNGKTDTESQWEPDTAAGSDDAQKRDILLKLIHCARLDLAAHLFSANPLFTPELAKRVADGLFLHRAQGVASTDMRKPESNTHFNTEWLLFCPHAAPVVLKIDYTYLMKRERRPNYVWVDCHEQNVNLSVFEGRRCSHAISDVLQTVDDNFHRKHSTKMPKNNHLLDIFGKHVLGSVHSLPQIPSLSAEVVKVPALSRRKALGCLFASAGLKSKPVQNATHALKEVVEKSHELLLKDHECESDDENAMRLIKNAGRKHNSHVRDRLLSTEEVLEMVRHDVNASKSVEKWGLFGCVSGLDNRIKSNNNAAGNAVIGSEDWEAYYTERVAREQELVELRNFCNSDTNSNTANVDGARTAPKVSTEEAPEYLRSMYRSAPMQKPKPGEKLILDGGGIMGRSTIEFSAEFHEQLFRTGGDVRGNATARNNAGKTHEIQLKQQILLEIIDDARKKLVATLVSSHPLFTPEVSERVAGGLFLHKIEVLGDRVDGKIVRRFTTEWLLFSAQFHPVFLKLNYRYNVKFDSGKSIHEQELFGSLFRGGKFVQNVGQWKMPREQDGKSNNTNSNFNMPPLQSFGPGILGVVLGSAVDIRSIIGNLNSHAAASASSSPPGPVPRTISLADGVGAVPKPSPKKAWNFLFACVGMRSVVSENLKSIHKVLEKASSEKLGKDEWDSDDEDVVQSIADYKHTASANNADRPGSDNSMDVDDVTGAMGIGANAESATSAVTNTAGVNNNINSDSNAVTDVEMRAAGDEGGNPVGVEGDSGDNGLGETTDGLGEKKVEVSAESTGSEEAIKDVPRP